MTALRILSRASALAIAQAQSVERALRAQWPDVETTRLTRSSAGDRDRNTPLANAGDNGIFTADLSEALAAGHADIVVHSWKDLPIAPRADTLVAATLPRADIRDVLLVRRTVIDARPPVLRVLTSSPRRAWQAQTFLAPLLPWPVTRVHIEPVRGNVPTRLAALERGDGDALVVAKAALDRLLDGGHSDEVARLSVRRHITHCRWMVLPLREFPAAPAQGALALEVAATNRVLIERLQRLTDQATERACLAERAILASYGGGCQEAIGVAVLERPYGQITSVRGRGPNDQTLATWSLRGTTPAPPPAPPDRAWPGPGERFGGTRVLRAGAPTAVGNAVYVARAEALPAGVTLDADAVVWVPGPMTWTRLAGRGVWVNGSADGLGDEEVANVDSLAGRCVDWTWLTHGTSGRPGATATYDVRYDFPDDLGSRTHFYWTAASAFRAALARFPAIRAGWHASGPGRTARVIRETLESPERASIWLDYDSWLTTVLR